MRSKNPFLTLLRFLHLNILRIHFFALRNPRKILFLFILSFAGCFSVFPRLTMQMSIDDLIDKDFATYQQLHDLKKDFYDQDEIFITVRSSEGRIPTKDEVCLVSSWIQGLVDSRGDINAIISSFGIAKPVETANEFRVPPLLKLDCTNRALDETETLAKSLKAIGASPFRGTLISDASDDLAILIYPAARVKASIKGTFNPEIVESLKKSFQAGVLDQAPTLRDSWTGDGIFQYYLHRGYEHMPVLNLLISIFILIAFRIFFGTFKSSVVFLSVVTWTSLPVYALMAIAGHPIDVLSSTISLMLFIGAIEDFIFLSHFMRDWSWRRAFPRVILPSFCTSLTTALGFGSLMLADLDIVRRFGLWAAVGSMIEWLMMFVLLPAVLVTFPRWQNWVARERSWMPKVPALFEARPPKWLTACLLLVFPLSFVAAKNLNVSDSPERLLHPGHEARVALDSVEKTRGWRAQISLVFRHHADIALNSEVLKTIRTWPLIDQVEDPYEIDEYMTAGLSDSMKGQTQTLLRESTLGHRLGPQAGQSRAILYVKNLETVDINQMRRKVSELCPGGECWLAGSLVSYGELGERILGTLYDSLSGSLIFVTIMILILSLCFREKQFFAMICASLWGPVALLLVFYLFKVPVSYITSMIASIVVGLAGDNAVHFMMFSRRKASLKASVADIGPASLIVTISTCLAATTFFFGYFDPMRTLGLMMIVGLLLAFLGDVFILQGMLGFFVRKKV